MVRRSPFLLLIVGFAVAAAGCGGSGGGKDPAAIVESWSRAINASDNEAAADLFADAAVVIQGGRRFTLPGHEAALSFNAALPCGGRIVDQALDRGDVTATFVLTRRPGHVCGGTGATAVAVFRIASGKITLWHQLPTVAPDTQSA